MKVILLRGLPGAGKSTWVAANAPGAVVCSADSFLYEPDGTYNWSPTRLGMAHGRCMDAFQKALDDRQPLIVVDNCNLTNRDLRYYVEHAERHGAEIEIRTIHADPLVAQARGLHGVPAEKYRLLVERLTMPLRPDWVQYEVKP